MSNLNVQIIEPQIEATVDSKIKTELLTDPDFRKKSTFNLGVLDHLIGYHMRRAQLRLYNNFARWFEDSNITPSQLGVLIKIKHNQGISQTALAKANGIERSTLGEIVDRFEKRNFVDRRKHPSDRRAYALHLTSTGEEFLDDMMPKLLEHEKDLTKNWSEIERNTLLRLLLKLAEGS